MPLPASFVVLDRLSSIALIAVAALLLDVRSFPYRALFVGLLFSHFFLGFYYSRGNVRTLGARRHLLAIAALVLLIGLYFSTAQLRFAPHFLIVHTALSDAYLLRLGTRLRDPEHMNLVKTAFYCACFALLFLVMPTGMRIGVGAFALVALVAMAARATKLSQLLAFELPLLAIVGFAWEAELILDIHYLGFYHIMTWYLFSFWMLAIKERSPRKTLSFFSMVGALSLAFVALFEWVLGMQITELGFARVIGFWSILHITTSIPLSKFNPRLVREFFYPRAERA